MEFQIGDLTELLSELSCIKCNKLLSVLPIYSSSGGSICGRCKNSIEWLITSNSIDRNTAYEAVAKHLLFPCVNKAFGCVYKLKHVDVENHEKVCKFRVRTCPFNVEDTVDCASHSQCDWTGTITWLPSHLRDCHSSMMLRNPNIFTLRTNQTNVKVNCMQIDSETDFILLSKYDEHTNKFYCMVMCGVDKPGHNNYAYQLELGQGDEYILTYRRDETVPLQDTSEALKNLDTFITVDVASAANLFSNFDYNLQCKVSITKKHDVKPKAAPLNKPLPTPVKQETALPPTKPKNWKQKAGFNSSKTKPRKDDASQLGPAKQRVLESNKLILEELECPVCNNYMIPPIFICSQGHSLCHECKSKILACPTCRIPMGNTRNYALEKMTQKVSYPCKYSHCGCTEVLPVPQIAQHEAYCNTQAILRSNCPIAMLPPNCTFQGLIVSPVGHIYEHHANLVLMENHVYGRNVKSPVDTNYYVTICCNEIFIVCCKNSKTTGPLKFNFLHVGMKANQPKYRYRLTFVDQTKKGMTFIINQLCQVLPSDINTSFKKCLEIPLDMLEPYILNKGPPTVFYKFNIEKM